MTVAAAAVCFPVVAPGEEVAAELFGWAPGKDGRTRGVDCVSLAAITDYFSALALAKDIAAELIETAPGKGGDEWQSGALYCIVAAAGLSFSLRLVIEEGGKANAESASRRDTAGRLSRVCRKAAVAAALSAQERGAESVGPASGRGIAMPSARVSACCKAVAAIMLKFAEEVGKGEMQQELAGTLEGALGEKLEGMTLWARWARHKSLH